MGIYLFFLPIAYYLSSAGYRAGRSADCHKPVLLDMIALCCICNNIKQYVDMQYC